MSLQNQYRDMTSLETTTEESQLSSLTSQSTMVPTTALTSAKRRAKAPAEPASVKKTKTASKFSDVANLLQQYRPPPVASVQHERDIVKEELQKTKDEATKQKTEALQQVHKTKIEALKQQTKTMQQLQGTVQLMDQVRSQLDVTISERDKEIRDNLALKEKLCRSTDEIRSAKSQAKSLTDVLSQSQVQGSRLQHELDRTNTTLKEAKKELASTKKDATLAKQVLLNQKDDIKKELETVKTDASITAKLLKNKNEEVARELVLVKTDAAVTEKLLENKVEQVEDMKLQLRAMHGLLMQELEHTHQGNATVLENIKRGLDSAFGMYLGDE